MIKRKKNNYNNTPKLNPSHFVDEKTNFQFRKIELVDIDKAVFDYFNNKFYINNKSLELIKLDSEFTVKKEDNFRMVDDIKSVIDMPYFTYTRLDSYKKTKVSPTNKTVIYSVPKQKENGVVIEDWITTPPIRIEALFQFTFHTTYRFVSNQFQEQWFEIFKNKRALITLDGEKFEIRPDDYENMIKVNFEYGDDITKKLIYNHEMNIYLEGYLRLDEVKKKERINNLKINISEKTEKISTPYNIYFSE